MFCVMKSSSALSSMLPRVCWMCTKASVLSHTQQCSGALSGSACRNDLWHCSGLRFEPGCRILNKCLHPCIWPWKRIFQESSLQPSLYSLDASQWTSGGCCWASTSCFLTLAKTTEDCQGKRFKPTIFYVVSSLTEWLRSCPLKGYEA